jgi:pSer/pThr/pTyr-binding forkhead associated (FHA) protein
MLKLTVYENDLVHSELELNKDEELIAGRSQKTDLMLSHEKISREHFKIYFSDGQWIVEDLGSKNGTVINGKKITEHSVANGDVIKIATFSIKLYLKELIPSPDEDMTVIAEEGEFGEEADISKEPTVKDPRRFSVPPPVEEPPAGEEVREEEAPEPVHDKTEVIRPSAEEPEPAQDKTEVIRPAAEEPEPVHDKTEVIRPAAEEPAPEVPEAEKEGEGGALEESAGTEEKNRVEIIEGVAGCDVCEFDDHILVGRSTNCDVIIRDGTVSREHFTISRIKNKYILTNLNKKNVTYLNDRIIKRKAVKDGDIVKIGSTTLKVKIFTPGKDEKKTAWKRIAAVVAVIVVGAVFVIMFFGREVLDTTVDGMMEQFEVIKERYIIGPESGRKGPGEEAGRSRNIELYLNEGKEFFDKGDFSSALESFSLVIEIDPENREALDYIESSRAKIEEERKKREGAERKRIELEREMESLLSESVKLYEGGQYKKARARLTEAGKLSSSSKEVSDLMSKVNAKIKEEQRIREGEQRRKKLLADVRTDYASGIRHYKASEYYPALVEFRKVVSLDINSYETAEAERLIPEIKEMLSEMTAETYDNGLRYYEKEDYEGAMIMWQKVLDIDPEHPKAKKGISEILVILDQKAEALYHQGIVYEGVGKIDEAVEKWKEVIKILPVKTNEYYKQAIDKLKEHGG